MTNDTELIKRMKEDMAQLVAKHAAQSRRIEALEAQHRWISVSEGFPKESGKYLIWVYKYVHAIAREKYGYEEIPILASFNEGNTYFLGHNGDDNPAQYWKPITPPEDSSDD